MRVKLDVNIIFQISDNICKNTFLYTMFYNILLVTKVIYVVTKVLVFNCNAMPTTEYEVLRRRY